MIIHKGDTLDHRKRTYKTKRWALIITQVGGGFTGIVIILDYLQNLENMDPPDLVISIGFVALYTFVTVAGMLFAQNERRTSPLRGTLAGQLWRSTRHKADRG